MDSMFNKKNIRVVFMGTPEFAVESMMALLDDSYNIVGVFTSPDRPAGRGKQIKMSAVKELALAYHTLTFQPEKINQPEWIDKIKELNPDIIVVAAYGQIISQKILDIPKFGCINVHASLLPKYRGASPTHFALLNGEKETGVTIMKMDDKMDTGPILKQMTIAIEHDDNLITLHDKLAIAGSELLLQALPPYLNGDLKPQEQEESQATYTKILKKIDGRINWQNSAVDITNQIKAYCPWPGTFTEWNGRCVKIIQVAISDKQIEPGKFEIQNDRLYVGSQTQALEIIKLQMEGRRCLLAAEFIKGCSMIDGYYCQ
ncbi:MAG TPA: methionyl-tRNA formyltransferase [bacterium]|nr:methionyl-tRNA formyltransferase [bacterium]